MGQARRQMMPNVPAKLYQVGSCMLCGAKGRMEARLVPVREGRVRHCCFDALTAISLQFQLFLLRLAGRCTMHSGCITSCLASTVQQFLPRNVERTSARLVPFSQTTALRSSDDRIKFWSPAKILHDLQTPFFGNLPSPKT